MTLSPGQLWQRVGPSQLVSVRRRDEEHSAEAGTVDTDDQVLIVAVIMRDNDAEWARTEAMIVASNGVMGWTVFLPEYWEQL